MTKIFEQTLVRAPLASASAFLATVLRTHTPEGSDNAHMVLHAGDAQQGVIVTVSTVHHYGDMTPRFHIHWMAERAAGFPVFDGELLVASDENYESFQLVLDGSYAPPGGIAGAVFDAAIGRHIAQVSARDFLASLRLQIEALFRDQERTKAVRTAATAR